MFGAQLVGQLVGALLTPMAFMLFYRTGQVNVPGGPYPAPFADIYRGACFSMRLGPPRCFVGSCASRRLALATGRHMPRLRTRTLPRPPIGKGMAVIGTKGFGALPKHCTLLMGAFFAAGMLICLVRDTLPRRAARFVPSPMAMSVPFYIGAASVRACMCFVL